MRHRVPVLVLVLAGQCVQAQRPPEFEIATVRLVDISTLGDSISMNIGTVRREEVTFGNATLRDCIRFAFGIASDSQINGPDWIRSKRNLYNIVAKGPIGSSREQLQLMLQTLLAERFHLMTHREQKQMSYFALVPARTGPKIRKVEEVPDGFKATTNGGRINTFLQMPGLAYLLSRFETELPVIDETGLSGMYEVKLEWALRPLQNPDSDAAGASLFTALQEQLGLRLDARKGPVPILVVDSAEKVPTDN